LRVCIGDYQQQSNAAKYFLNAQRVTLLISVRGL